MQSSPHLLFHSSRFVVQTGEDEETNPGIFGRALAHWLGQQFVAPTFSEDDVIAEDFGWCVLIPDKGMNVYLACSSAEVPDNEWRVFVFAEGGSLGRFFGRPKPSDVIAEVYAKLKSTLQGAAGIDNVREEAG